MLKKLVAAVALIVAGCDASPVSPGANGVDPLNAISRPPKTQWVICWDGSKVKYGKPCPPTPAPVPDPDPVPPPDPVPQPDPTPVPDPDPPTQTCWDGSVIPETDPCPVQPPPPTQTCPDGSVIPQSDVCPPPPTQTCPDGSVIPADQACPPPPTPAHIKGKIAFAGDSQSVTWPNTTPGGNWTNTYAYDPVRKSKITFCALAVGGSTIGAIGSTGNQLNNPDRIAALDACNPEVVVFAPSGSNDWYQPRSANPDAWLAKLWTWTDPLVAKGYKVVVASVLKAGAAANKNDPLWAQKSAAFVAELTPKLMAQAPAHGVVAVNLDSLSDKMLLQADTLHLTSCSGLGGAGGQCELARIMAPVLDQQLGLIAPAPTPTPTPTPPAPSGPSGLADIPSNGPLAIKPAGIPAHQPQVNEDKGAFRFICGAGQLSYDDPIVYPGQPGKSHLHQYYGNTKADANSTFDSLRTSGDSTCNIDHSGNVPANRSAYWMPAMLDGKGNVILPDYVQVYYKREPNNSLYDDAPSPCDPANPNKAGICIAIPNGLRFISGYMMSAMKPGPQVGEIVCGSKVWKTNVDGMSLADNTTCPVGTKVELRVASPKCWNGQLDSPDHMSHLAVVISGKCPSTHPYLIPQFTIGSFYTVQAGDDVSLWSLSSDMPGMKRGSTLHFDYFEAWDNGAKAEWTDKCIDEYRNSSAGNLCGGHALVGADSGTVSIEAAKFPHRIPLSSIQ